MTGYCNCGHTIEAHKSGHSMERFGWKCVYCSKCTGYLEGLLIVEQMKPLVYCVASRGWPGWLDCVKTWYDTASEHYDMHVAMDLDVVPALQECYESTTQEILGFLHDDVIIHEKNWDSRVLKEFQDESVGLVSFTGARAHCRPELYLVPYYLPNLARQDFFSNMRDAEKHGARFTGERDSAVADGCTCFVRRGILDHWIHGKESGFPRGVPVAYFMWMENLCCEVRRQGFRIRMVGVDFEHLGGRTSAMHGVVNSDYEAEHRYFFENNRDCIPFRVPDV